MSMYNHSMKVLLGMAGSVVNLSTRRLRQKDGEFEPNLIYMKPIQCRLHGESVLKTNNNNKTLFHYTQEWVSHMQVWTKLSNYTSL